MPNPQDVYEVNFDGLIGPTHNFSGLAYGNLASTASRYRVSSPRQAALQGLEKMKLLHSLGIKQGFLPPQDRPDIAALRGHGFKGDDRDILAAAWNQDKELFLRCCSASSMWCANAATVSPSSDTRDGKCHLTPANLRTHAHRAIEAEPTARSLKQIFRGAAFAVHEPLQGEGLTDEGAANHMRLTAGHHAPGVNVFVYGQRKDGQTFPSRQSLAASTQLAKSHQLEQGQVVFIEQNPEAIERGVFHNDVIATSNEHVFLVHEQAYQQSAQAIEAIREAFRRATRQDLVTIVVPQAQLSVDEAVWSYLFNSQIVTLPGGDMAIIAPVESSEGKPRAVLQNILKGDNPIRHAYYIDLRQSMANGGGPACLRLRVALTATELSQVHPGYILDDTKFVLLEKWIRKHYRAELKVEELSSIALWEESRAALEGLTKILGLGKIYPFQ